MVEPVAKNAPLKAFTVIHPEVQHTIRQLQPDTEYVITVHVGIKGTYGQGVSSVFSTEAASNDIMNTVFCTVQKNLGL